MRIAYFTSHVFGPDFVSAPLLGKRPNPAGQNFHEKLIKALGKIAEVEVFSYVPLTIDLPEKDFNAFENVSYHYVRTPSNRYLRALVGPRKLYARARKIEADIIFYDSLNRACASSAIRLSSSLRIPAVAILTDHPGNITGLSPAYAKSLLSLSSNASACFALTPKLSEAFGFADKPSFVQPILIEKEEVEPYMNERPYIYYGGALFVKDGLKDLVEAYQKTRPDFDLLIAGHGPYENELAKIASEDNRILFLGQVDKTKHLSLIKGSALSINPRPYRKEIDDYAVPSKVMEYLCYAPMVASTISTPLKQAFGEDVNWIEGDLVSFFSSFFASGTIQKKNTASDRVISLFGLEKTSADLQEFLASLISR